MILSIAYYILTNSIQWQTVSTYPHRLSEFGAHRVVQDRVDARADEVQDAGDVVQTLKRRQGAGEAHRQLMRVIGLL